MINILTYRDDVVNQFQLLNTLVSDLSKQQQKNSYSLMVMHKHNQIERWKRRKFK